MRAREYDTRLGVKIGVTHWQTEDEWLIPRYAPEVERHHRIYFIEAETSRLVKVGFTTDVGRRLKELRTSSPEALKLLTTIIGTRGLEAEIHRRLKTRRQHVRGEWYRIAGWDGCRALVIELMEEALVAPAAGIS